MAKKGKCLTYQIQGVTYATPPVPPANQIRNHGLPRKEQVWRRRTEYEQWNWNTDPDLGDVWFLHPEEGQLEWYEHEIERLHTGEWIYINNEPVYLNKYAYFFHQWHTLQENIHASFRDTSLEFFRFYELIEDDPFTLGICGIKGRRLGMSSMAASIQLLICLIESNNLLGIVSKTGTDAKEMYLMVKFSLENLPSFLMPEMRVIGEKEMHFSTPPTRISKNNKAPNSKKGLNNRCGWLPTAENSYDGRRLRCLVIDEAAKYEEANVTTLFSKISETLVTGASVVGKVMMFSTVNKGDKGGNNFRDIWNDSDHTGKVDAIGQTASRLKRFFIEGYRGVNGYCDAFGNSVIDTPTKEQSEYLANWIDPTTGKKGCPNPNIGAKQYRQERRDMLANDPEKLAEEIRKFPFFWEEVFKDANNLCYFNTEDLSNQTERVESAIQDLGRNPQKDENGRRGFFVKQPDGLISWKDDNRGMWYVLEFLRPEESNKFVYKNGIKCPDNTGYGAAGLDTFANAKATVDKGSDAACVIHKRYNPLDPESSNMPIAFFIGRPSTKREFHDQIFNALQYYGVKMLAERSPTDWEDYAIDASPKLASPLDAHKKLGYLVTTKRANNSEVYGIAPQDKEAREAHLTEMIEYALHNMHKIWFRRILKDMFSFDIDNRTIFDGCMAWGYALMGLKESYQQIAPPKKTIPLVMKSKALIGS